MSLTGVPHGRVHTVTQGPQDRSVHQVEGEGDASEILVEARLEETFQPGQTRHTSYQQGRGPVQVKPLVVEDSLRLQEGEVVPTRRVNELIYVEGE